MPAVAKQFCNIVQDFFEAGQPGNVRTPFGMLESLYTSENLAGGVTEIKEFHGNEGRIKALHRKFYQREGTANVINGAVPTLCEAGTQKPQFEAIFEFDPVADGSYIQITIDDNEMQKLCAGEGKSEVFAQILASKMNSLYASMNQRAITRSIGFLGSYVGGGALKNGTAFTGSNPEVGLTGLANVVRREFEAMDMTDEPFVVGWNNAKEFYKMAQYGCCNDGGIDLSRATGYGRFFMDKQIPTGFGTTAPNTIHTFLTYMPGAIVPMEFTYNREQFKYRPAGAVSGDELRFNTLESFNDTLIDRSGRFDVPMVFDIYVRKLDCDRTVKWVVTIGKLFSVIPTYSPDAFAAGDPLVGTNGILAFNAVTA
jgi:hypothetical protein